MGGGIVTQVSLGTMVPVGPRGLFILTRAHYRAGRITAKQEGLDVQDLFMRLDLDYIMG